MPEKTHESHRESVFPGGLKNKNHGKAVINDAEALRLFRFLSAELTLF